MVTCPVRTWSDTYQRYFSCERDDVHTQHRYYQRGYLVAWAEPHCNHHQCPVHNPHVGPHGERQSEMGQLALTPTRPGVDVHLPTEEGAA